MSQVHPGVCSVDLDTDASHASTLVINKQAACNLNSKSKQKQLRYSHVTLSNPRKAP